MTTLADFRADAEPRPAPRPLIEVLAPKFEGRIVAFDNAIAATGWVYCLAENAEVRVIETGMIETQGDRDDESSFQRGVTMFHAVEDVLRRIDPHVVAHEAPFVGARSIAKTNREGTFITGTAIRISASLNDMRVHMVQAQRVKKLLTGNGNAKKNEVASAIRRAMPGLAERGIRPLNQNVYDAIGIALVTAEECEWRPE